MIFGRKTQAKKIRAGGRVTFGDGILHVLVSNSNDHDEKESNINSNGRNANPNLRRLYVPSVYL